MGRLRDAIDRIHELDAMKCPECGAQLNFKDDQEFCYCSYCGTQVYKTNKNEKRIIFQKINDAKIKKEEVKREIEIEKLKHEERESKRNNIMLIIMMGLMFIPSIAFFASNTITEYSNKQKYEQGFIRVGYYEDYIGKNYEVVISELHELGFEKIETYDLNDSGLFKKENSIESISIGGNSKFSSETWFKPSDKVIISYH